MNRSITTAVLSVAAMIALSLVAIAQVQKRADMPPPSGGIVIAVTNLKCTAGSGSQDVSKSLYVLNTSGKTIPANTSVQFTTSDGEKDYRSFGNAIAPGKQFVINTNQPKAGAYTCTAWIRGTLK